MDELWKLESVDTAESRRVMARLQTRLKASREPTLLGELVELYFKTGSKRARKILTTLRETHSQDFFDKLNDSVANTSTRLPSLKLLAHTLNSQMSWLYRIVDHPLFSSILNQLKTSGDVVVLSNALFVVSAILPMVPSYIGGHLHDIFTIFCELATIRTTNRLGLTPKELHLHLEVAIYYFFMQLYALFPCNLSQFLRSHYAHSSQEEVAKFQQHIVPLFYQVQLHPGLITGGEKYELSKAKWGAMEPSDIATLGLQLCMDTSLDVQHEKPHRGGAFFSSLPLHLQPPPPLLNKAAAAMPGDTISSIAVPHSRPQDFNALESRELVKTPSTPLFLAQSAEANSGASQSFITNEEAGSLGSDEFELTLGSSAHVLSGLPDPSGLKSPQELEQFWSPSVTLGNTSSGKSISHDSSRTSLTQQSLQPSNISSPISDSALSSAQPTPGPSSNTSAFTFKNYSPTASVDGESLLNRQVVQSAIHTPSCLEDSHSSASIEPLSQSMRVDTSYRSSTGTGSSRSSPSKSLMSSQGGRSHLSSSLRVQLGRFISFLSPKKAEEGEEFSELSSTAENEEFIEINVSDLERAQQRARLNERPSSKRGILTTRNTANLTARRRIEVGEECLATEAVRERKGGVGTTASKKNGDSAASRTDVTSSDPSDLSTNSKEEEDGSGVHVAARPDESCGSQTSDIVKISNLPDVSSRPSLASSESSQGQGSNRADDDDNDDDDGDNGDEPDSAHADVTTEQRSYRLFEPRGLASSVPERGAFSSIQRTLHARTRSSNSDHTVMMVQERLQELVESEKSSSFSQSGGSESVLASSSTPVMEQSSGQQEQAALRRPTVTSNESTSTLRVQSPEGTVASEMPLPHSDSVAKPSCAPSGASNVENLQANSSSEVPMLKPATATSSNGGAKSSALPVYSSSFPSRFFIRRVSVCHPDNHQHLSQPANQSFPASAAAAFTTTSATQHSSCCLGNPSPVSLLDQFVARGEVLHRGQFESIPLTELEGVDWNHFGGCPHSEEFGMMRSQVALLHSQLLFERHQCLQHARRNRRLLSKARTAMHVEEELYSLRDQLNQKEQLVASLRKQLHDKTSQERSSNQLRKLTEENQVLMAQNARLKETNLCMSEEAHRLQQHNEQLQQELKRTNEQLVKMENERSHLAPKLRRAEQLQGEVDSLSRELQILGELYQQQKEEAQDLARHSQREQELMVLCASMRKEKEASRKVIASLSQQLRVGVARGEELAAVVARKEEEITSLRQKLLSAQGKYQAKMKALQDKYTSIVVVGQQLETQILELRGRPAHHKKKYVTRHQRSNSHPAVVVPRTTTTANRTHHSNTNSPSLSHRH